MANNTIEHPKVSKTGTEDISADISDCGNNNTGKDVGFSSIDAKTRMRNSANKKSAASSKERRKRYIAALEMAVHNLRTESTSLSAQLSLLQENTNGLSSKNVELKLRMQSMENEVHLQDARNEALKKEIQELRAMVRQSIENEAPTLTFSWSQNQNINQLLLQKQEIGDFEMGAPLHSPSYTENSSNTSPSEDTTTVMYNDYRLF